jgi:hypothetical protein
VCCILEGAISVEENIFQVQEFVKLHVGKGRENDAKYREVDARTMVLVPSS